MVNESDPRTERGDREGARLIKRVGDEIARRAADEMQREAEAARQREALLVSIERASLRAQRDALARLAGRPRLD